jgi:hypothetical protein
MTTTNNNTTSTNFRLFVLLVLLVLSTGAFAQANTTSVAVIASTEVSVSNEEKIVITTENNVASMDFAVWFMGSKKTSNSKSNGSFSKKQLINSGINTNSVLIRSFLKKINTQENGVA